MTKHRESGKGQNGTHTAETWLLNQIHCMQPAKMLTNINKTSAKYGIEPPTSVLGVSNPCHCATVA